MVRENQTGTHGQLRDGSECTGSEEVSVEAEFYCAIEPKRVPYTAKPRPGVAANPLVRDGLKNGFRISRMCFARTSTLYFLYEVYDPAHPKGGAEPPELPGPGLDAAAICGRRACADLASNS